MRYYNIKTTNTNGYVVSVDSGLVPKLRTLMGDLESTLFAVWERGYVFETKGKKDSFRLQVSSDGNLDVIESQREGFSVEEISGEETKGLMKKADYRGSLDC